MSSLQDLVDALAAELGRPVGIDDRHFRALAYSSHDEGVDQVRRDSIRREAPQGVTDWLLSLGISEQGGQVRVPANHEFEMDARLCLPLRFDGALLGYLWLIDEPPLQDSGVLDLTERYGEQLAAEMVRVSRLESADRELQTGALARLLFEPDPNGAAGELGDRGALTAARNFAALVAQAHAPGCAGRDGGTSERATAAPLHPGVRLHLTLAAEEVRRGLSSNHALAIAHQSEVVVVIAFEDPTEPVRRAAALLAACNSHLGRVELGRGRGVGITVGVGASRSDLDGLRASYREARLAAEVGNRVPEFDGRGPVAWEDLGAYRTLATLVGDRDPGELLPPALPALLAEKDGAVLLETLETYLELGADAKVASERLFLHRSSLYKRLHRVERLTGYDLRRGDDRLELHLGLRLWRLAGSAPGRQSSSRAG